jgi:biopolymer transport protein ExbD
MATTSPGPKNPGPKGYQKASGTGPLPYSHTDFTYVRRKRKLVEDEESHELNIVPYLDILVNLIMFLLVTQATLVSLGIVDVSAPSYAAAGPGPSSSNDQEKNLRLTIGIAGQGFYIAAKGGVLPGQDPNAPTEMTAEGVTRAPPTVPKRPDGSFDFPLLTAKLRAIKDAFPKTEAVFVAADDNVPYDVLVKTLDASREDAKGPLFPAVAFTQIN